jgi:aminoglycoside phosphotransferase (APT) family kinase protein
MDESPNLPATIRHYRQIARTITQSHFGSPPSRIVYRRSGLTNYVFAINHVEGQFVIRISPDAEKLESFRKELWATQKVREAGVPSPEVLVVGQDVVSEPYMISRRVTGSEATHHPKRHRIVHEMGRYAQIINSIRTQNFGTHFDSTTNASTNVTWSEYLDQELDIGNRLRLFADHNILSDVELNRLWKIIDDTRTLHITPALNHGDLRLKNVIVDDDGEITAIIDWDDCVSTIAPQWELSIALHDLAIDEKHLFIEGYGLRAEQLEEMAPLIKAFNIINYASAVGLAVETEDHKSIAEFKLRLRGVLDLYSLPS